MKYYTPTADEERLMQQAFDRRRAEWNGPWDYTEWEEYTDECISICKQRPFTMIIFTPTMDNR